MAQGGASSPPPRDLPRLPTSVASLASKYQPNDSPTSPAPIQPRTSPIAQRRPSTSQLNTNLQPPQPSPNDASGYRQARTPPPRRQSFEDRRQDADDFELKEKERWLREREREIQERTEALERERTELRRARGGEQRPTSAVAFPSTEAEQGRYSYSTTNLVPPQGGGQPTPRSPKLSSSRSNNDHAEFCGCAECSAAKYAQHITPSEYDLRPPEPPIQLRPEKPKGWMRRLSMPGVGAAFASSDPKKHNPRNSVALSNAQEDGRIRRLGAGIGNGSQTNLGRR